MSYRTALLQSVDTYFHAYNRGVDKMPIFFRPADYQLFLDLIPESLDGLRLAVLNFCLMPNHFHFTVRQDEPYAMSRFFEKLCNQYVKRINPARSRTGHLFKGRYKPKPVLDPATLPTLSRYIHINPVTAGLVRNPEDWEFSSCQEYFGLRKSSFLDTGAILETFSGADGYMAFLRGVTQLDLESVRQMLHARESRKLKAIRLGDSAR